MTYKCNFTSSNIQSTTNYLKLNKCVYITTVLMIISVFAKCLMDKEVSKVFTSHSKYIYRQRDPPGQKCVYLVPEVQSQNFYAIYQEPFVSEPYSKSLSVKKYSEPFSCPLPANTCLRNAEDLLKSSVNSIDLTSKQMKDDRIFSLSMSYEVQHGYYNDSSMLNLAPDVIERFLSSSTLQLYLLKAPNINRSYLYLKPSSRKQTKLRETPKQSVKIIMSSPFVENVPEIGLEERHRQQATMQRSISRANEDFCIASLLVQDLSAQSQSERNDFETELTLTDLRQSIRPVINSTESSRMFEILDGRNRKAYDERETDVLLGSCDISNSRTGVLSFKPDNRPTIYIRHTFLSFLYPGTKR